MADESKGDGCCPAGSLPALVLDESRKESLCGKVETLESGLVIYSVTPKETSTRGIILVYDVHGFSGGRIKGVCDTLSSLTGAHVIMADVYGEEQGVNDFGGFMAKEGQDFLKKHHWDSLLPKYKEVAGVLAERGVTSVGALGFCWGAYPVVKMSEAGMIKAGASCHPSLRVGPYLYDTTQEALASGVATPLLLCPASNDPDNVKEGGELVKLVEAGGNECIVKEFPDMKHGWVPRGDATDEAVARDVQLALETVADFFKTRI